MSGQTLMSIWQAVAARDPQVRGKAPTAVVQAITKELARPPTFRYSDSGFRNSFPKDTVDFENYKTYMRSEVIVNSTPLQDVEAAIEKWCWEKCRPSYTFGTRSNVTLDDLFKLWQMFNRIAIPGSCPPLISVADMNWWASKIAVPMARMWTDLLESEYKQLTYLEAIKLLNEKVFLRDSLADAQRSIEQLRSWLVMEVSMTGWLFKRTRKQGNNWTTWQRRFFQATPGELRYYTSANVSEKDFKGKVSITMHSRLESLTDYKAFARKYANRFRLSNIPMLEIELASVTAHEKNGWMAALDEIILACKNGTTPVQAVLADRIKRNMEEGPKESIDQAMSRLKSVRLSKVPTTLLVPEEQPCYTRQSPKQKKTPDPQMPKKTTATPQAAIYVDDDEYDDDDEEEEFDNNTYSFQKQKVKEMFDNIDKNGNGLLNEREFDEFIRVIVGQSANPSGVPISIGLFNEIDEDGDGNISFEEYYSYFTKLVLDPNPASVVESSLRDEFLKADRQGNESVKFGDFSDFVSQRRRSFQYQGLMTAIDGMDKRIQSNTQFSVLREFVIGQCGPVGDVSEFTSGDLGRQIRDIQGDEGTKAAANSLAQQWFTFVQEKGLTGREPQRIAKDYNLIDVVCYTTDKGKQPANLSIDAARWEPNIDPMEPADLILPAGSSPQVPVVTATDDSLKYFGCRLANEDQEQIATLYQHSVRDMTYVNASFANNSMVLGGPGMERSSKCRFLSPLSQDSGYLVIARWEGDEETMEITGFQVGANASVYIPGGTMHSLDYLKGSWRIHPEEDKRASFAFIKKQFTPNNDRDLASMKFELKL